MKNSKISSFNIRIPVLFKQPIEFWCRTTHQGVLSLQFFLHFHDSMRIQNIFLNHFCPEKSSHLITAFTLEDDSGFCENILKQRPYLGDNVGVDSDSFSSDDSLDIRG
ncbi:unnamed protein product [Allacma fusca]|uniref:Uncharacterized protein n=1 Tax=Allacma fusca TaxID=39272 RepID=A0A8J2LS97_9HEXA|nr:unnamed protein product [Allacma fusca]